MNVFNYLQDLAGSLEVVENKIAMQKNLRMRLDSIQNEFAPMENQRLVRYLTFQYSNILPKLFIRSSGWKPDPS